MLEDRECRNLLLADLALEHGIALPHHVIEAFEGARERDVDSGAPFLGELARIAGLPPAALEQVAGEAERWIAEEAGDARAAWARRVRGRRSIHLALSAGGQSASRVLARAREQGQDALPTVPTGRYEEFVVAGEGGMGVVYMALDTAMSRFVAFKMVRPDAGSDAQGAVPQDPLVAAPPPGGSPEASSFEDLAARFLQEAWVTGGLEHPGIVPVYELGRTPKGIPYYTMRFVHGERTLAGAIREASSGGPQGRLTLLEPFLKVCDTLAYAHARGVVHRDVKPQNVALGEFGEVILLDWGLARLAGRADTSVGRWEERIRDFRATGDLRTLPAGVGTPGYMSPEAARGELNQVDAQSDVYSLGVILFEILTGRLPERPHRFHEYVAALSGSPPPAASAFDATVPRGLSDVCRSAMAPLKADRPPTVEALASAIRAWQAASAVEQEVEFSRREATEALDRAEALRGSARLAQLDAAAASVVQVRAKRPHDERARVLEERIAALRRKGLDEHQQETLRRVRRRTIAGTAAVLVLGGVGYLGTLVKSALEDRSHRLERARFERAAAVELSRAESLPDDQAVEAITRLIQEFKGTATVPLARLRRGDWLLRANRREQATAAWLECAILDAPSGPARQAWQRIARLHLDEGRPELATEEVQRALRLPSSRGEREELRVLEAEALWSQGRPAQAAAVLSELADRPLEDAGARQRAEALQHALPMLYPLPFTTPGGKDGGMVARFRRGKPEFLVRYTHPNRFEVRSLEAGGAGTVRLAWTLDEPDTSAETEAFDLNGDGVDELLVVSFPVNIPMGSAGDYPGTLRVLDLSGTEARECCRRPAPHGGFVMGVGDLNGDKRPDIVLGAHHAGQGVHLFENRGDLQFEAVTARWGLSTPDLRGANVRAVAIADVTGDGSNELLLGCSEWSLYDLEAFTWDDRSKHLARVPVTGALGEAERLGLVNSLLVRDVDFDGRLDAVFALDCLVYDEIASAAQGFLPQGLYAAKWDPSRSVLAVEPLQASAARIRVKPETRADALPVNQGTERLVVAHLGPRGDWLVSQGRTYTGRAVTASWLRLQPAALLGSEARLLASTFTHRADARLTRLTACDLDGDGSDELLVQTEDGSVRAYALGGPVRTTTEAHAPARDGPTEPPPEASRLEVAHWFRRLGWDGPAVEQYRRLLDESPGESMEVLARAGLVDSLARQWRWDEVIAELAGQVRRARLAQGHPGLRLAEFHDRIQDWESAAGEYEIAHRTGEATDRELPRVATRAEELAPWGELKEEVLPTLDRWIVSEPGYFALRLDHGVQIRVRETDAGKAAVWLPVLGSGGSYQLHFELEIECLGHGHALQVGFLDLTGPPRWTPGLSFMLETNSMERNQLTLSSELAEGMPLDGGTEQPRSLDLGVAYRGVLSWDSVGRYLGLTLRRADDGRIDVSLLCRAGPRTSDVPRRLGVRVATDEWTGGAALRLTLGPLMRPRGAGRLLDSPLDDALGSAHCLLAQGRWSEARQAYQSIAAAAQNPGSGSARDAHFYDALLGWAAAPSAERAPEVLDLAEGLPGSATLRRLLRGRDSLLEKGASRTLGEVLFDRTFAKWRAVPDEALRDPFLTALDLVSAALTSAARRSDPARRREVFGAALDSALDSLGTSTSSEERARLRSWLELD